ncbi:MAG: cation:proton antiporter [Actinomycetota bacterium]
MTTLSPAQIMLAAALVVGLATACQVLAPRLRVPALLLLLPAGFVLGWIAPEFQMDKVLGPAFGVAVDLMVAIILFQGGLELGNISLQGKDRSIVRRLVWIGGPINWIACTLLAHYLLGLSWPLAFLLGAILIVSGPTVVTPILDFAKPQQRVRGILLWEGTMLDPIGGIFAIVIFQVVRVTTMESPLDAIVSLIASFAIAIVMALVGAVIAVLGTKLVRGNILLGTQVIFGTVVGCAAFANFLADASGLLTALLLGIAAPRIAKRLNTSLDHAMPFFNTIATIGLGILFISIAALVPSPLVGQVALPAVAMAVILILIVRPAITAISTAGSDLSRNQRTFIAWMDPRGIVAAATASSVSATLIAANVPGAGELLPAAFVIIAVTVFVYGLTAAPVAKVLGVRDDTPVS